MSGELTAAGDLIRLMRSRTVPHTTSRLSYHPRASANDILMPGFHSLLQPLVPAFPSLSFQPSQNIPTHPSEPLFQETGILALLIPPILARVTQRTTATVASLGLPYRVMEHLSAPDLLELDLADFFVIGAYVVPARSPWSERTDVDPARRKLAEAVTVLSALPDKPLLVGGDINGRVGERIPAASFLARSSTDPVVNKRGRWWLRLCSDTSLTILNGAMKESIQRGAFTSFQPMGASVNDYCCVSSTLLSRVPDSALHSEESHTESYTWSDHAQLNLSIAQSEHLASQISVAVEEPSHPFIFDDPTPLDIPLKSRLESGVLGDCKQPGKSSVRGLARGGMKWNRVFVLENGSNDSIAAILAVLCAAKECPADQQLTIYSASQYAIRSFCYWACDHETEGWSCTNGLILRDSVEWLAQRTAAVEFRWVSTTEPNKSMIESASTVTTTLEEVSEPKGQPPPPISADEVVDDDEGHRGRKRERELMYGNLLKLLACRGKSNKPFWLCLRAWTDPKPFKPCVSIGHLHDSFKARLNPPDIVPDSTPQQFFSRRVTGEDMQEVKRKLHSKSFQSAVGIDKVSYAKTLTIPNQALVDLYHACMDNVDAPQHLLVTLLIGILKQGEQLMTQRASGSCILLCLFICMQADTISPNGCEPTY
ncbi:hypothetical protein R3P38DRAFT_3221702 [Favolaschia claudopus]|uniref:RNase H type-1 domain-containing protein n=1 Tax=Favolaschia claudopus TaxID=2862362 RepID=A0AAW0A001_9AGAR